MLTAISRLARQEANHSSRQLAVACVRLTCTAGAGVVLLPYRVALEPVQQLNKAKILSFLKKHAHLLLLSPRLLLLGVGVRDGFKMQRARTRFGPT